MSDYYIPGDLPKFRCNGTKRIVEYHSDDSAPSGPYGLEGSMQRIERACPGCPDCQGK